MEKILLVDDDPLILSSYQRLLRQFSFDTAGSAREALDKIAVQSYAVVLSDLRMPGMDGLALLRRVHEIAPDSICILLTGNADLHSALEAVNKGNIFRYLEKPYPTEMLAKVLLDALKQYRRVISEKGSTRVSSEEASGRRPSFRVGDEVIVMADGLRQGQRGVVEEVLPSLEEHDFNEVCIIAFRAGGAVVSRGHYFAKELRGAAASSGGIVKTG
jgi:DNA-binding NtrC family response regulator